MCLEETVSADQTHYIGVKLPGVDRTFPSTDWNTVPVALKSKEQALTVCPSYLRICVFAREVAAGLLLACPSLADPGVPFCIVLHSTPLPIPVPPGRQPPSSLYQPPGDSIRYSIRYCQSVADFLPHFPATEPRFPPSLSFPYLSPSHRCRTPVPDVPGLGAAPQRPGSAREAAGTLQRDTAALGCRGAQPGRGSSRGADPFPVLPRSPGAGRTWAPRQGAEAAGGQEPGQGGRRRGHGRAGMDGWMSGPAPLWGLAEPHSEPPSQWALGRSQAPLPVSLPDQHCRPRSPAARPAVRRNPHPSIRDPGLHPLKPSVKSVSLEEVTERKKWEIRRRFCAWSSSSSTKFSFVVGLAECLEIISSWQLGK